MEQQSFGASAIEVSRVGLGCNSFGASVDPEGTKAVVDAALDAGISLFDTADVYGPPGGPGASEDLLGQALEGRRDQAVIATKCGVDLGDGYESRGTAEYLRFSLERSLRRLRTDYVDILYLHVPDPSTPIAETLTAFAELEREGRIRAAACSNLTADQLQGSIDAASELGIPGFAAIENRYSLLRREDEGDVLPLCESEGLGYVPFYPLENGLLTGKYRRGEPAPAGTRMAGEEIDDATFDRIERLEAFAAERGRSLLELAIAGIASRPAVVSVIAGATKPDQVRANAAAGTWELSAEDRAALEALPAA